MNDFGRPRKLRAVAITTLQMALSLESEWLGKMPECFGNGNINGAYNFVCGLDWLEKTTEQTSLSRNCNQSLRRRLEQTTALR